MIRAFCFLVALLVSGLAQAQQFGPKDEIVLKPDTAYLLFRSSHPAPMLFIKTADEGERARYLVARKEALDKALVKYERKLKSFESEFRAWEKARKSGTPFPEPKRPVKPTDETLDFPPIERLLMNQNVGKPRVIKNDGSEHYYLVAVPPGTHAITDP